MSRGAYSRFKEKLGGAKVGNKKVKCIFDGSEKLLIIFVLC